MTNLLRAASNKNWREVNRLILGGADPAVVDDQELTALHYAAIYGNPELAQTLIEHGPAELVFREAPGGRTSLSYACGKGHLEVTRILTKAGGKR